MSTKTNFKRIALVAVSALGMGVLSSAPSQAAVINAITITTSAGSATTIKADSTTAGSVTVKWQSITASDSVVLSATLKSKPTTGTAPNVVFSAKDTLTAVAATVLSPSADGTTSSGGPTPGSTLDGAYATTAHFRDSAVATSAVGYNSATFRVQLDSLTSTARVSGDYVYTITATPYTYVAGIGVSPTFAGNNTIDYSRAVSADITITIAALASESTVASPAQSSAYIGTSSSAKTADSAVSVPAAVSATDTPRAYITVKLNNASGVAAAESLTATTTIGTIGTSTNRGKSSGGHRWRR